jgi:hypothetical protein
LFLLHRHNNAEHLPIEESDESDYGEDEPLDDQEIDLGIGIHPPPSGSGGIKTNKFFLVNTTYSPT